MTIHPFFAPSVHLSLLSKVHQNGEAGKVDIRIQFFQMQIWCDVSLGGMLIDRTSRSIGFRLLCSCIQKIIFDKVSLLCNTTHILPIYIITYVVTSYNKIQYPKKGPANQTATVTCPTLVIAKITLEMPATPAEPDKLSGRVVFASGF